jgi:hypothetical protein
VKRSLLDPLPRPLSTKALVALVALVVAGTGIAVIRFLESSPGLQRHAPEVYAAPESSPNVLPGAAAESLSRGTPRSSRSRGIQSTASEPASVGWRTTPAGSVGSEEAVPSAPSVFRPADDS